ncbi:hypothetical protein [uncultured Parasphingorhabdus sp.]|uniref:hypothetical protein n=1 Tax=uncultured Parasphingorhabdus sp. TaxID=2709694 RepID=UPI0030DA3F78|tara:strand:+ start:23684 stop:23902 length:219 start_codon:yes stop_codon:yes gene_type:complete
MDLIIEAKILLLMFVWPAGQADNTPLWTNDVYSTLDSCEDGASERKAMVETEYGPDARIVYYCFDADDRMDQ